MWRYQDITTSLGVIYGESTGKGFLGQSLAWPVEFLPFHNPLTVPLNSLKPPLTLPLCGSVFWVLWRKGTAIYQECTHWIWSLGIPWWPKAMMETNSMIYVAVQPGCLDAWTVMLDTSKAQNWHIWNDEIAGWDSRSLDDGCYVGCIVKPNMMYYLTPGG